MSRRRKNYCLDRDAAGKPILPANAQTPPDVIEFARGMRRTVDFRPWLGKGLDPIVRACQRALWRKKQSGTREDTSLCTYFSNGLSYWFGYLAERSRALGRSLGLKDITGETVQRYIDYLAHRPARTASGRASYASQWGFYTHTKAILAELCREGLLPPADEIFPVNPYPAVNRRFKGATPLSREECKRLLRVLESDLGKIRAGELRVPDAQGLIIRLLLIAARTGLNTTPLLELGRDALRVHPIHPDRRLLLMHKRRGSNTHIQSLQRPADERVVAAQTTVKNDVVTLYQEALGRVHN